MINAIKLIFWSLFYCVLQMFVRVENHSIVFGSWHGESFSDNTRYLAEWIGKNHPEYTLYWVGKKSIKKEIEGTNNIRFLEMGKLKTNLAIMKCKYCFISQKYHVDISRFNVSRNSIVCYLHHGTPVKKWGDDGLNIKRSVSIAEKCRDHIKSNIFSYDFFASSSSLNSKILCTAMKSCGCTLEKIIPSGTPRNDMLVNFDHNIAQMYKEFYFRKFGIDENKNVIAYLPTYRRLDGEMFSFSTVSEDDYKTIESILEKYDAVLLEKSHFASNTKYTVNQHGRIILCNKDVNVQEMLMYTDVLISDYSGAFLDFTLLNRPIIHFAYDYEFYRDNDSGLYYDINDFNAGCIAWNFDDLCKALESELKGEDIYKKRRCEIRKNYMTYETGNASKILFNTIIQNK